MKRGTDVCLSISNDCMWYLIKTVCVCVRVCTSLNMQHTFNDTAFEHIMLNWSLKMFILFEIVSFPVPNLAQQACLNVVMHPVQM